MSKKEPLTTDDIVKFDEDNFPEKGSREATKMLFFLNTLASYQMEQLVKSLGYTHPIDIKQIESFSELADFFKKRSTKYMEKLDS